MTKEIGEYLRASCSRDPLPDDEVRRLVAMTNSDDAQARQHARNELVETNMRLVASRAKKYAWCGIPYRDLMQVGVLGLMRAIDLYDSQQAKLTTYATLWIDAEIQRYVDRWESTIRQPVARRREHAQLKRAKHRLTQDLGRQPTPDELAAETGIDREMIATLERTAKTISLDEVIFDPTGPERIDIIAGDADVEAAAEVTELWARVAERIAEMESVDPRIPQVILEHYVGGRSFVDLAEEFGVSRQRVGQIKDRAVTILRAYLSGDKDLAETWRTRDCEVHNAGPAVTHKV